MGTGILSVFMILISLFAHAERPIRGFYEVPVPENLKSYSRYPVKFKADNYQTSPETISFPMPSALMGEEKIVTMSKVDGTDFEWSGSNVTGHCETFDRYFKCSVRFHSISFDQTLVGSAIRQQYITRQEIQGRSEVAKIFNAEPIGILFYKMRGRTEPEENR